METSEERKKKKEEKEREDRYKKNFTEWIIDQLRFGKESLVTYLPFVPALVSSFSSYLKDNFFHFTHEQIFDGSILIQVVFILGILVYQVYQFGLDKEDGLRERIDQVIKKFENNPPNGQGDHNFIYQFTHTNTVPRASAKKGEEAVEIEPDDADAVTYWKNFKNDFYAADKNIEKLKFYWIVLWVVWFCFYIALLMKNHSTVLFDLFMIVETFCFAACYHWLTYHEYQSQAKGKNQNWLAMIMVALLVALAIADQSTQDNFMVQMVIGVLKTVFSCVFLGLLIGVLTIHVKNSPIWLKILLFCYVALQPVLFGIYEMPSLTKSYFGRTLPQTEEKQKEDERLSLDTLMAHIDKGKIYYSAYEKLPKQKQLDSVFVFHENIKVDSIQKSKSILFVTGTFKVDTIRKAVHKKDSLREIGHATEVINASVSITNGLGVVLLNFCLALKYLLMFYFIWLLRYDHLLVYFMRTQGDHEYVRAFREKFEKKIEKLGKNSINKP